MYGLIPLIFDFHFILGITVKQHERGNFAVVIIEGSASLNNVCKFRCHGLSLRIRESGLSSPPMANTRNYLSKPSGSGRSSMKRAPSTSRTTDSP